jgi:hypothetical protein
MEESKRGVFALDGVTGYLIAVVLLLSILAFLTVKAIAVQSATATQYYEVQDRHNITMYGSNLENEKHIVIHGEALPNDKTHKYKIARQ